MPRANLLRRGSSMNHYESATEYYGNHEPYLEKKPRKKRDWKSLWSDVTFYFWIAVLIILLATEDSVRAMIAGMLQREDAAVATLDVGDSFDVACGQLRPEEGACMTVTLEDIQAEATCRFEDPGTGRYVRVLLSATIPEDTDEYFLSPFRNPRWMVLTADDEAFSVRSEPLCETGVSELGLMAEVPGTTMRGSYWLAVPEDAATLRFEGPGGPLFTVPLAP